MEFPHPDGWHPHDGLVTAAPIRRILHPNGLATAGHGRFRQQDHRRADTPPATLPTLPEGPRTASRAWLSVGPN